jgi:hypothetical protein
MLLGNKPVHDFFATNRSPHDPALVPEDIAVKAAFLDDVMAVETDAPLSEPNSAESASSREEGPRKETAAVAAELPRPQTGGQADASGAATPVQPPAEDRSLLNPATEANGRHGDTAAVAAVAAVWPSVAEVAANWDGNATVTVGALVALLTPLQEELRDLRAQLAARPSPHRRDRCTIC